MSLTGRLRRLLGAQQPRAKRVSETSTPTTSTYYRGMDQNYRWFRQDELVRKCITSNAFFSTQGGFETTIESEDPERYHGVKQKIDAVNKRLNLDHVLLVAQVKRSIYGRAGFEVVTGEDGLPTRLLPLQSPALKPDIDENWNHTGFTYNGRKGFYKPWDVLYFTNLELEADRQGLSDVEPVRMVCEARHELLRENFPEIARTLWAPYVILKADTRGLPLDEAEAALVSLAEVARAGKSIAVNESVEAKVVDITPDIKGLTEMLTRLEQSIICNYGVPGFLLGKPVQNRATAYAELEAYTAGTVASIQRSLKREVERQLYTPWTRMILADESEPPVQVKHRWNPVRAADVYAMADAAAKLWGTNGAGPIGGKPGKVWDLMGWDPRDLEESP